MVYPFSSAWSLIMNDNQCDLLFSGQQNEDKKEILKVQFDFIIKWKIGCRRLLM